MPRYHPRGVQIRLSASDLDETITPAENLMRKKGAQAANNADTVERKLRNQQPYLFETNVPIAGDENRYSVNFISKSLTPFLQVQVRPDAIVSEEKEGELRSRDPSTVSGSKIQLKVDTDEAQAKPAAPVTRSKRSHHRAFDAGTNPPDLSQRPPSLYHELRPSPRSNTTLSPKALCLHVLLSDMAYLPGTTGQRQSLKIELFFNGMMVKSVLMVERDVKGGVKSNHQFFAGTRVAQLAERPWIIIPPGQNADGSLRTSGDGGSAEDRWIAISAALLAAAEERGVDKHGKAPPSAAYLEHLATMKMPEDTNDMQTLGGRKFGVIDVVISAGSGCKAGGVTGAQYLHEPLRLVDENFKVEKVKASSNMMSAFRMEEEPRNEAVQEFASERDAEGETDSDLEHNDNVLPKGQLHPESLYPRGNGFTATAPSGILMPSRAVPQGSAARMYPTEALSPFAMPFRAQMYPMEAPSPFVMPSISQSPYLSAGASLPQTYSTPWHRRPAFTASGLPLRFGFPTPAALPRSMLGLADPPASSFWTPPFGSSQDGPGNATSGYYSLPRTAPLDVSSTVKHGWSSQSGRTSNINFLEAPLRPGLPFAGRLQFNDADPMQTLYLPPPGPPPPVGTFTMPQRGVPAAADPGIVDPNLPRPSFCISRLVITCALQVIVDYHWGVPQLVRLSRMGDESAESDSDQEDHSEVFDPEEFSEEEYKGTPVTKRRRYSTRLRAPATPPPTSLTPDFDPDLTVSAGQRKRSTIGTDRSANNFGILGPVLRSQTSVPPPFAQVAPGPRNRPAVARPPGVEGFTVANHYLPSERINPALLSSQVPVPPQPRSRATSKRTQAVPAILDDPELLFRRKSRLRPGAQVVGTPPPSSGVLPVPIPSLGGFRRQAPSRSLSSAPTVLNLLDIGSPSSLSSAMDLSSMSDFPHSSSVFPKKNQGRSKLRQEQVNGLKMATGRGNYVDPSQNLCETNPELNKDCVIAYAQGDKGLLRQVRCERQGWFYESEVVVGMRFFIPG